MRYIFPSIISTTPIEEEKNIFTDGSSNGKSTVYVEGEPPLVKMSSQVSAQQAKLIAVILAIEKYTSKLNLYKICSGTVSCYRDSPAVWKVSDFTIAAKATEVDTRETK